MKKTVSIIVCTYNGEKYLREQLESIVNQTYPVDELIIQDDCSTDKTFMIAEEYAKLYPYVRIFRNPENIGINENFKLAISRAAGDCIATADQDDIWGPDKIEKQLAVLGDNWLVSCHSIPFYDNMVQKQNLVERIIPNYGLERTLFVCTPIAVHTMLFTKDLILKVPNIDYFLKTRGIDTILHIVVAAYGKIVFCKDTAVYWRRHDQAATYIPQGNYTKNFSNAVNYVLRTYKLWKKCRPFAEQRVANVLEIIFSLPEAKTKTKENAIKLGRAYLSHSLFGKIKLVFYTVKFRQQLFFKREPNFILSILRGLYFPISCCDYFKHVLNKK